MSVGDRSSGKISSIPKLRRTRCVWHFRSTGRRFIRRERILSSSPSLSPFPSPHDPMPQPVIASVRVKPSKTLGLPRPGPVEVHALDLVVPLVWTPTFYFFPPVSQADHPVKETVLNLISSLADVLEHFPLLGGTVKPDDSGNLKIHSDGVGADFIYELRDQKYPGVHVQGLSPRGAEIGPPGPGEPLIAIKFTAVCAFVLVVFANPLTKYHSSRVGHMFCALPSTISSGIWPRLWTLRTPMRGVSRTSHT